MSLRWNAKFTWIGAGVVVLGLGAVVVFLQRPTSTLNTSAAANRQRYAALYQAAWRQDDGNSPTLMTATLLVPPAVTALGQDTGRSSAEEQLWRVLEPLDAKAIPVVVTIDSVTGAIPDETIQNSVILSAPGLSLSFDSWHPLVAPSHATTGNDAVTSQSGVAVFTAATNVDWNTLTDLKLEIHNIPGQSDRVFTWAEPRLLLQV